MRKLCSQGHLLLWLPKWDLKQVNQNHKILCITLGLLAFFQKTAPTFSPGLTESGEYSRICGQNVSESKTVRIQKPGRITGSGAWLKDLGDNTQHSSAKGLLTDLVKSQTLFLMTISKVKLAYVPKMWSSFSQQEKQLHVNGTPT